jgi:putative transposase
MLKAYKYRIYPTSEQQEKFAQHFGCARWVYNWGLSEKKEYYAKHKKSLSKRALQDKLVREVKKHDDTKWLDDVNSQTLLSALDHLDTAYKHFFRRKQGFPKYKKKSCGYKAFQCPQHVTVDFETKVINLPKIKQVKAKFHREFDGKIKTCTVKQTPTGKYFVSILVETPEVVPTAITVDADLTVGIDLGIKDFLITSHNTTEPNNKFLDNSLKRLKTLQRRLSKKQKGSANRAKARKILARLHEKVANQRTDAAHQASAELVYKSHDTSFAVEDLNIKGMMKNPKLAKSIADCGWSFFLNTLEYKSKWVGKNVIRIDRWKPSSKTCSGCGHKKDELSLSERSYKCEKCGLVIDRDYNAAINIKDFAIAELGLGKPEDKPVDHALTGVVSDDLVIRGMKQEAPTRITPVI